MVSTVTVPNATRNTETSSAIRSSERRKTAQEDERTHRKPDKVANLVDDDVQERIGAYRQTDVP